MSIGNFTIGTHVAGNDGKTESSGKYDKAAKLFGHNYKYKDNGDIDLAESPLAWKNGKVFSSPFWIGYKRGRQIYRIGYSDKNIQNCTQNFVHKYLIPTPYFLNYQEFASGVYMYSGVYNRFSMWNK